MMIVKPTRRSFLKGCTAAVAGVASTRFTNLAFAARGSKRRTSGGGLSTRRHGRPQRGDAPERHRPWLLRGGTTRSQSAGFRCRFGLEPGWGVGIHPAAAPLHSLYQDGKLAVVLAAGLDEANRSHFDAQEFMERGTPGDRTTSTGWLARHFASTQNLPDEIIMPSLSVGSTQVTSLLGDTDAVNLSDVDRFNINNRAVAMAQCPTTGAASLLQRRQHLAAHDRFAGPRRHGHHRTQHRGLATHRLTAPSIPTRILAMPSGWWLKWSKSDLGLRVAALDLGGWDTHNGQGDGSGGQFAGLIGNLAGGLAAFYTDLDGAGASNYTQRLTVVVQSEFGRRLVQNADRGTDHGHGNLMMVLSGNANGGLHGQWPGIGAGTALRQRGSGGDDGFPEGLFRDPHPAHGEQPPRLRLPGIFGLLAPRDCGGTDLPPDYTTGADGLFADGFEIGNTEGGWLTIGNAVTGFRHPSGAWSRRRDDFEASRRPGPWSTSIARRDRVFNRPQRGQEPAKNDLLMGACASISSGLA